VTENEPTEEPEEAPLAARMARGTAVQQGSLAVGIVTGLISTTALARSLSLAEFGVYGFVVALATYLYFVIGTAENAAVNEMAAATDRHELDLAFTRSVLVYASFGIIAGLVIAGGGALLIGVLDISPALERQGRLGAVAIGFLTATGWTTKVFQDFLRATHRFAIAGTCEAAGNVLVCAGIVLALVLNAPLWCVIAAGGALPLWVGLAAVVVVLVRGLGCTLRPREVHSAEIRSFLRFSGGMLLISSSDLVINSLDRTVVGVFRGAPSLALYEAASKLNALVRTWVGNLSVTIFPVLSTLRARDDHDRERDLLVLGTRYMLAATVGPTVALMVLSDRLLAVWLGQRYVAAAPTAVVFLAVWLVAPNMSIASTMVAVTRRLRQLTIYSWGVAAVNLTLSVALTAWLGLIGVAIGTTAAVVIMMPYFVSFAFEGRDVTARDFARAAWIPAYGLGAILALALLAARVAFPLDHIWSVVGVAGAGVLGYWAAFLVFVLDANERELIRTIIRR